MIRFLQHDMISKPLWDECISAAVNGNLYSHSWYLDIVSPGWCALVADNYEAVFPLPVASRAGIRYIIQPYFTQQLGLFSKSETYDGMLSDFLNAIPSDYKFTDINLNTFNVLPAGVSTYRMTNLELDLSPNYTEIASTYQTNLKRSLKKAARNQLNLSKSQQPEELISLFRVNRGQDLKHLKSKQYMLIKNIAYKSLQSGIGEIWSAHTNSGQLVAAILWVTSHQRPIFLFSALSETGKKLHAMPWLIDNYIRQKAGESLILDFEGSNDAGLARFYSSFGAKKTIYPRYQKNNLPTHLRLVFKIWRFSKKLLKK